MFFSCALFVALYCNLTHDAYGRANLATINIVSVKMDPESRSGNKWRVVSISSTTTTTRQRFFKWKMKLNTNAKTKRLNGEARGGNEQTSFVNEKKNGKKNCARAHAIRFLHCHLFICSCGKDNFQRIFFSLSFVCCHNFSQFELDDFECDTLENVKSIAFNTMQNIHIKYLRVNFTY